MLRLVSQTGQVIAEFAGDTSNIPEGAWLLTIERPGEPGEIDMRFFAGPIPAREGK